MVNRDSNNTFAALLFSQSEPDDDLTPAKSSKPMAAMWRSASPVGLCRIGLRCRLLRQLVSPSFFCATIGTARALPRYVA